MIFRVRNQVASATGGCEGLGRSEIGTGGVEIGTAGSGALERGGGRGIGSTGKLMLKVGVGGSWLSVVDGSGTTCKSLFRLVP
ncbi:unnamed protein product, partial [Vitis vinifera]|uniref:Uncharacterized protein n=1 Tax=Vitis vinifera TaxID=29760 RepID=D7TR99_VITVI